MKKVTQRAISTLLVAAFVILGIIVYGVRYVNDGAMWASYFGTNNITGQSTLTDRNGTVLATLSSGSVSFSQDYATRLACYHAVGDLTGNVGTGVLSAFSSRLAGFNIVTGTTKTVATNLELTLDASLNVTAYNAMAGRNGAVLVANYKTGEILCMVSTPSQDPASPSGNPADGTYLNKGISSTLVPGSVFKLITLTAAVETIDDLYSQSFYCAGGVDVNGIYIKCTGTHGTQTVEQALANSCNCAFASISMQLGPDTLAKYAKNLGFTSAHSMDGIQTAAGSFDKAAKNSADLAWSGIGQYTDLVSPYAMLRLVSAIGNGGSLSEPTILGHSALDRQTKLLNSDTAQKMKEFMSYNVTYSYGTGTFPGLNMCAKSGTAEVGDGRSHAWFTGFLDDAEHPYAFVVVIENGGGGLRNAGAVANTVLQAAVAK